MKEHVVAGIIGAFLFSLVGGALHFIIYQFGYIAGACGLITVSLSIFGYQLFSRRKNSLTGVLIAAIISIFSILAAGYLGEAYGYYKYYHAELNVPLTFLDAVQTIPDYFASYKEALTAFIANSAIALVLGAVASFNKIKSTIAESRNP